MNNYEVRDLLAQGISGWVYLAQHPVLGRRAALKVLRRDYCEDEALVTRFLAEVRTVNALFHPNIAAVLDLGRLPDGLPYLLLDLLEGESLAARLERKGRLTLEQAMAVVSAAAAALGAAHRKGIVHGGLKPGNLFLARDLGDREQVKLLDFGVSKLRSELGGGKHSGGAQLGTPSYLAPEQCREGPVVLDARADVYALGTILYEMLCGRPPFMGPAAREVLVLHLTQVPPAPRVWNPALSAAVEAVILRALAKDPGDRFASMSELSDSLAAAALNVDSGALALPPPVGALALPPPLATPAPISVAVTPPDGTWPVAPAEITAVIRNRRRRRWLLPAAGAATAVLATVWLSAVPLSGLETPPAPATISPRAAVAPPRAAPPSPPVAPPAPLPGARPAALVRSPAALVRNEPQVAPAEARLHARAKRPPRVEPRPVRRRAVARTPRSSRPSAAAPQRPAWMDKW